MLMLFFRYPNKEKNTIKVLRKNIIKNYLCREGGMEVKKKKFLVPN